MLNLRQRYSLVSNPDAPMPPPHDASSTADSSNYSAVQARSRHDSNALLMLPAPLSVDRRLMASTPSVGMSRGSDDQHYYSDGGSGSNQRLISSPVVPDHYSDSLESTSTTTAASHTRSPHSSRSSPPQDPNNPFRSMTTSPTSNEEFQPYSEHDDLRQRRGVGLQDHGPVPGPDGVRRIRPTSRRPTSQAPPPTNRYSRNSTAFSLPPGAAPPQPNYGGT